MELITNEMLRIGDAIDPSKYLIEFEKEVLINFDLDIYSYSGYNIFKMIIRLSGNAESNNRTTFAHT